MYRIKITVAFFIILLFTFTKTFSQLLPLSENTTVSLITCGSGAEIYSLFGHTAIRIKDVDHQIDQVYNYGTFDFNTPNFYLKFVKGDLRYMASSNSYPIFIDEYQYDKRNVYEQILNFSQLQKQMLFDDLNRTLISEDRYYTYKFIDKNCTTMVIDILNKTLGKEVIVKTADRKKTYREILYPYFKNHFYENLGISIIFGKKVDLKGERLFLPAELQQSVKTAVYNGQPLCKENKTLLAFSTEKIQLSWWNNFYGYSIILLLVVITNNTKVYMVYLFLAGSLGLFLTFAGFYSLHRELAYNYNILLFNPILLILVYFYLKKIRKGIYIISVLSIICNVLYVVIMANKIHFVIVIPLIITSLIALIKLSMLNKKKAIAKRELVS